MSFLAFWPFIISKLPRKQLSEQVLRHEQIHFRQQLEMLLLPFYCWYLAEFVIRLLQYRERQAAYRNISFEREAYTHDHDKNYLQNRKFWAWAGHLKKRKNSGG